MRDTVWSFVERVLPRGASALVSVVMAALLNPQALGMFTTATIVLSLFVSFFDVAARQLVLTNRGDVACDWFLRIYRRWFGPIGAALLFAVLLIIAVTRREPANREALLMMLPVALVPLAGGIELEPLTSLQSAGRWPTVARAQGVAAVLALAVSLPLVFVLQSILAAAVHLMLAEMLFCFLLWRSWAPFREPRMCEPASGDERRRLLREYAQLAGNTSLGWFQSQADRVMVGMWAGPATLGLYGVAGSVARSASEASAAGASSVLRVEMARDAGRSQQEMRGVVGRSTTRSLLLAAGLSSATAVVAVTALPLILGSEWSAAVDAVPALAASALFTALSWNAGAVLQAEGRLGAVSMLKFAAGLGAVLIGLASLSGVGAAAWAYCGRELAVCVCFSILARKKLPAVLVLTAAALAGGVLVLGYGTLMIIGSGR